VLAVVWALDVALAVSLGTGAMVSTGVGGRDVAAAVGGSGLERGGCGGCRRVVCWPGSVLRGSGEPGGCSEARGGAIVVVVNDVDGGCTGVVSGDVAGLVGSLGGAGFSRMSWGLPLVCMAVSQVLQSSTDVPTSFSRRGGSSSCIVCMAVLTEVWVAVSMVWGVAWVLKSTGAAVGII
jgi:hypothetical protein